MKAKFKDLTFNSYKELNKWLKENTFKVILTEGKKHQIRRMCSALFQEVADLKRVRILNIKLGTLKPNQYRTIKGKELKEFLQEVLK